MSVLFVLETGPHSQGCNTGSNPVGSANKNIDLTSTVATRRIDRPHRLGASLGNPVDVITTTLKRQWFAKIVAGTKRIEYREIKPYWTRRLRKVRTPFKLVLRNGMNPPIPVLTVRIDRISPSPNAHRRGGTYALHIGRVLKVEHWDRRMSRPR